MPTNNARRWTIASAAGAVGGVLLTVIGWMVGDYHTYWMIAVGIFISVATIILFIVFSAQARRLADLFAGKGRLAHWHFHTKQHLERAKAEYETRKARNKLLLIFITALFVLIGGVFALFGFDSFQEAAGFLLILLIVLGCAAVAAFLAPRYGWKRQLRSPPDIYIGPFSAWVFGEYTQWKAPVARPRSVIVQKQREGMQLVVRFAIITRYGLQEQVCRIPVPEGLEEEARFVAGQIARANAVPLQEKS